MNFCKTFFSFLPRILFSVPRKTRLDWAVYGAGAEIYISSGALSSPRSFRRGITAIFQLRQISQFIYHKSRASRDFRACVNGERFAFASPNPPLVVCGSYGLELITSAKRYANLPRFRFKEPRQTQQVGLREHKIKSWNLILFHHRQIHAPVMTQLPRARKCLESFRQYFTREVRKWWIRGKVLRTQTCNPSGLAKSGSEDYCFEASGSRSNLEGEKFCLETLSIAFQRQISINHLPNSHSACVLSWRRFTDSIDTR